MAAQDLILGQFDFAWIMDDVNVALVGPGDNDSPHSIFDSSFTLAGKAEPP